VAEVLESKALMTITGVTSVPLAPTAVNVLLINLELAHFSDTSGSDHIVLVDWGDGEYPDRPDVTQATVTENVPPPSGPGPAAATSTYFVNATHTYTASGDFQIRINILGGDGQSLWTSTTETVFAGFGGLPVPSGVAGTQLFNVPIAALTYNTGYAEGQHTSYFQPSNFYAPIDWGDGTGGTGNILIGFGSPTDPSSPGGTPYLYIHGTHTYTEPGDYTVKINAIGGPGQSIWAKTTITIGQPTAQPGAVPLTATAGTALNNIPLAGFTAPTGTKLVAAVDWGDGSMPTFATVVTDATPAIAGSKGTTTYTVEGSHTYATPGSHRVLINVIEPGKSLWAATTATVGRNLAPVVGTTASGVAGLALGNVPLGSFAGPASATYTAAIAWGDGSTPSFATVVPTSTPGSYLVVGSHKFTAAGKYTLLINVIESDGESVWGTTTVTIN
jgi:hypothetical protein